MFTYNSILTYIRHSLLLTFALLFIFLYSEHNKSIAMLNTYKENIKKIYRNDGIDLSLFCYSVNCKKISYIKNNLLTTYVMQDDVNILKRTYDEIKDTAYRFEDKIFINKIKLDLENNSRIEAVVNNHDMRLAFNQFFIMDILFLIFYGVIYFRNYKNDKAASLLANKNVKTILEGKLQYTVAGSMHHEMLGPITVIKDLFEEIKDAILLHNLLNSKCYDSNGNLINYNRRESDAIDVEVIIDYIDKISTSIDRLHGVLALLRESKDNRYSNGNKNILMLTKNLLATTSIFTSRHFNYKIVNEDLIDSLHLKDLPNGEYMNILSNLITNSVEAQCSEVILEFNLLQSDLLQILCIDNGTGVIGKDGNIIKEKEYDLIFNYGISSKDLSGNIVYEKKNALFKNIFKSIKEPVDPLSSNTGRGLGMYVIRETLKKHNGTIKLHSTSKNGTIFELNIKVEPYKYK